LVEEISKVFPITFIDFHDILNDQSHLNSNNTKIFLFNLMEEENVFKIVKKCYPDKKIIALHCFQVCSLIQKTLDRGYDHYISILNFSDEFQLLLSEESGILPD
jgi:Tat protein secretion system quality control protein TatD with DNase activity